MLRTVMHSWQSGPQLLEFAHKEGSKAGEQLGHPPGRWCWRMSSVRQGLQRLHQRFLRASQGCGKWAERSVKAEWNCRKGWLGKTSYLLFRQQRGMGKNCLLAVSVSGGHTSCVCFKDLCKWVLKFKKKKKKYLEGKFFKSSYLKVFLFLIVKQKRINPWLCVDVCFSGMRCLKGLSWIRVTSLGSDIYRDGTLQKVWKRKLKFL